MTDAEAVETSVTNSLSQDYSNLDDLLPLTCTDSPGFKPFTLLECMLHILRITPSNIKHLPHPIGKPDPVFPPYTSLPCTTTLTPKGTAFGFVEKIALTLLTRSVYSCLRGRAAPIFRFENSDGWIRSNANTFLAVNVLDLSICVNVEAGSFFLSLTSLLLDHLLGSQFEGMYDTFTNLSPNVNCHLQIDSKKYAHVPMSMEHLSTLN